MLTCGGDANRGRDGAVPGYGEAERHDLGVYGWTQDGAPVAIAHHVVEGRIGSEEMTRALDEFLLRKRWRRADGRQMRITATALDFGGTSNFGDEVRIYCQARANHKIWAVKGRPLREGSRSGTLWPKLASTDPKRGYSFYMLDVGMAKDDMSLAIEAMLLPEPHENEGPEAYHLWQSRRIQALRIPYAAEKWSFGRYLDQLVAEEPLLLPDGGIHWEPKVGVRNEAWDCLIYSYAAYRGLRMLRGYTDMARVAREIGVPEGEIAPYDGPDLAWGSDYLAALEGTAELAVAAKPADDRRQRFLDRKAASEAAKQTRPVAAPAQPAAKPGWKNRIQVGRSSAFRR